jgi:hypothetical protein
MAARRMAGPCPESAREMRGVGVTQLLRDGCNWQLARGKRFDGTAVAALAQQIAKHPAFVAETSLQRPNVQRQPRGDVGQCGRLARAREDCIDLTPYRHPAVASLRRLPGASRFSRVRIVCRHTVLRATSPTIRCGLKAVRSASCPRQRVRIGTRSRGRARKPPDRVPPARRSLCGSRSSMSCVDSPRRITSPCARFPGVPCEPAVRRLPSWHLPRAPLPSPWRSRR